MFVIVQSHIVLAQNGGVGPAGILIVVAIFCAWAVVSAIHVTRFLCLRSLQHHGSWEAAPIDVASRWKKYLVLVGLLAVCIGADLLCNSVAALTQQRHQQDEHKRSQAAMQRETEQSQDVIEGYFKALSSGDRSSLERFQPSQYFLTARPGKEECLDRLANTLSEIEDAMANEILQQLAANNPDRDQHGDMSVWLRRNSPDPVNYRAADKLVQYALHSQHPLEQRQLALEVACRMTNGHSAGNQGMVPLLAAVEQSPDRAIAVEPLSRWLRRKHPENPSVFIDGRWAIPGEAEVCEFLGRRAEPTPDVIAALQIVANSVDQNAAATARAALEMLAARPRKH